MIIQEPTTIELVDVNGKKKRVLGKINNVEISLKGKCVTKMTLQVTDATLYNIILAVRERLAYTDLRTIKHRRRKTLVTDIPGDEVIVIS